MFALRHAGEVLVGHEALARGLVDPDNTFSSVKRFIVRYLKAAGGHKGACSWVATADECCRAQGRKFVDVSEDTARVQFKGALQSAAAA
jgi:molecular chaperone DnaK (HSP70)